MAGGRLSPCDSSGSALRRPDSLANPGFTATAILCLSLGIGLNSAIFSVVDGVLLQPFPYPDADRIVVLNSTNQRAGVNRSGLSWLDLRDVSEQTTTLSTLAAFTGRSLTVSDGTSEPERYNGAVVSSSLFCLLGTPPALGRDFHRRRRPCRRRTRRHAQRRGLAAALQRRSAQSSAVRSPSTGFHTRSSA